MIDNIFAMSVLVLIVAYATISDIASRRIPNWLTLGAVITGIALNTASIGFEGMYLSILGMVVAIALFFPVYLFKKMGGGDVKLLAAIGAFCGPGDMLWISALTVIAGSVFGVIWLIWYKGLQSTYYYLVGFVSSIQLKHILLLNSRTEEEHVGGSGGRDPSEHLPYAVAIFVGLAWWLLIR